MSKIATLLIIAVLVSGCASQQQQQSPPQPPTPPSTPSPPQPQPQPSPEEGKKGEESSEDSGEQSEQEGQEQAGQEQEGQEQAGQEGQEQEGGLELPEVGGESGQEGGLELPEVGGEESEDGEESDSTSDNKDCGGIILIGDVGGMGDTGECSENPTTSEEESSDESESGGGAVASEGEPGGSAGEVGQYPEESSADRMERLSKELDKSIGDFDEILMEEQREISSVGRNMEGFGGETRQAGKIGLGEQEGNQASGGTISILNPEGRRAASIEGLSKEDIQTRVPEDIIPIDDDVVGKQLYEAAVTEDDPILRERLWEEYRKYKRY